MIGRKMIGGRVSSSPHRKQAEVESSRITYELLDRAANLRKYVVGIRADEADGAHDDHQNHGQHHRIFRNVLTTLIVPELL
jgi:hypothetical protein